MNNLYTYTLELRDRFSSALERAGGSITKTNQGVQRLNSNFRMLRNMPTDGVSRYGTTTNSVMSRANTHTNNLIRKNRELAQSYHHVIPQVRKVENAISSLNSKGNRMTTRSGGGGGMLGGIGGSMKSMLGGMGLAFGLQAAVSGATGFVSDSISKSLERQTIQTSFNVLAGDEAKGSALTKQLVGLSTTVGSGVYKNAQTMMGFGFDSTEVADNIKMLGNVSMGDAQRMESLTLAFSQIRATGKLMGQDLLQLVNAGFNPLEQMSRTTGKSMVVLKDAMSKGNISFKDVQDAFKSATGEGGRFEDMLGKLAATPAGKVKQLSAQWDEFKISAGGAFMPLVSMVLDLAQKMMPIIEGVITPLSNGVQRIVDYLNKAKNESGGWMDYFNIIKGFLVDHYLPMMGQLWELISNVSKKLGDFVEKSTLVKGIFSFFLSLYAFIYDILAATISGISWLFDNVVMPIMNFFEKAHRFINGVKNNTQSDNGSNKLTTGAFGSVTPKNTAFSKGLTGTGATGSSSANAIATGGTKTTNITINLGNLVNTITVKAGDVKEGAEKIRDIVVDELSRALTMAQANI